MDAMQTTINARELEQAIEALPQNQRDQFWTTLMASRRLKAPWVGEVLDQLIKDAKAAYRNQTRRAVG